ncbi:MAG: hypothetical protein K2M30_05405 [Desulfovibrionaceae bacterium]|nr:hypothetical protein [Desulfovibrionaceae bacterium]
MQYISPMRKTKTVLIFLALFLVIYFIKTTFFKESEHTITHKDYATAIALLNEKLPIQLDSETELRNVQLQDSSIQYTYGLLTKQKLEIKVAELQKAFRKEILKTYCANSDIMIAFRDSGYTAKYVYLDRDSQEIFSTEITPKECNSL